MGQCQSKPDVVNPHSGPLPSSTPAAQESSHKEGKGANHQNGEPVTTSDIAMEGGEASSATATASLADSGLALAGPVPPPVVAPELPSGLRPVASPAPSSASFVSAVEELESLEMSLEMVALPAAHGTTLSGGFTPPTAAAMHAAERRASDGKAVHPPVPASDAKVAEGKAPAVPGTSARDSANGVPPPAAGERIRSPRELCLAPEMVAIWEKEMSFSAEQRKALKVLRDTLAEEGLLEGWLDNLPMLYRYLQARKWGVNEAMTMIRDTLEFRKKCRPTVPLARSPTPAARTRSAISLALLPAAVGAATAMAPAVSPYPGLLTPLPAAAADPGLGPVRPAPQGS